MAKLRFYPRALAGLRLQTEAPFRLFRGQLQERNSETNIACGARGVKRILYLLHSLCTHAAPVINDTSREPVMEQVLMDMNADVLTFCCNTVFSDIEQVQGDFSHY